MCTESGSRTCSIPRGQKAIRLSQQGSNELRNALGQMELLMQTPHVNVGLQHLVGMMRHLQRLSREICRAQDSLGPAGMLPGRDFFWILPKQKKCAGTKAPAHNPF